MMPYHKATKYAALGQTDAAKRHNGQDKIRELKPQPQKVTTNWKDVASKHQPVVTRRHQTVSPTLRHSVTELSTNNEAPVIDNGK